MRTESNPQIIEEPALAEAPLQPKRIKKYGVTETKDLALIELAKGLNHIPWCEDYEKMISGMLYDSLAPPLMAARHRAHLWNHKYNNHFPEESTMQSLARDRAEMLNSIFGKVGPSPYIEAPCYIDYGANITIGANFYANYNLTILDCSIVEIGDNVMIGPNTAIYTAGHETSVSSRRSGKEIARAVKIGDDCWIGGNVVILPGVTIGRGCTIGAGSVVSKDIPEMSVAVGNPCRVVRKAEE